MGNNVEPIVTNCDVFSCEFSFEFQENCVISPKKIKVISSKYSQSYQQLLDLQNKLDQVIHVVPAPPIIPGVGTIGIKQTANNKALLILQNRLAQMRNISPSPSPVSGVMMFTTKEEQYDTSDLENRLARLRNLTPDPDEIPCCGHCGN